MQKYLFLLATVLASLSFSHTSYGQTLENSKTGKSHKKSPTCKSCSDNNVIEIDALDCYNPANYFPKCIPENSTLGIRVYNVNPYKMTVSASGQTSTIDFGNDSLFSFNISEAGADIVKTDPKVAPKNHKAGFMDTNLEKLKAPNCCNELDSIKKALKSDETLKECTKQISNVLDQLTLLNRAEKQLRKLFDTTFITKTVFKKQMWNILGCTGITPGCDCKAKTDTCCNCAAHTKYKELYVALNEGYACVKNQFELIGDTSTTTNFSLSGKLLDKAKGVTVDVKNAKGSFEVKKENKLKPLFDELTTVVTRANSDSIRNALLLSAEYIDECISKLCTDTMPEFFQQNYVAGPIEGDNIKVTPFILNLKGDTIKLKSMPIHTIGISGGKRVNVSSGISFSFLGVNDDDYSIVRTDNDSQFVIKKTKNGRNLYIPSLTTFLHFYKRNCGTFQGAGTLGLSVNPTSLETLKVMAGYSIIFGEERRAILSFGVVGGAVNRLKTKYESDTKLLYRQYQGLQETDLVAKRFRVGAFIGLSVNLSKLK